MPTKKKTSELETLEQYRVALDNAENQPEIAGTLADLGYDTTIIGEGKTILSQTENAYYFNQTEDDETNEAYANFMGLKEKVEKKYLMHRKKARVIFRNDELTLEKMGIKGSIPKAYVKWLDVTKRFYALAATDTTVQAKLARLKITPEELTTTNTWVDQLKAARSAYLREKGESQEATKAKDAAFVKLDDWMSEFYAVAKIGLEDHPQLLEALGKIVKS